MIKPYTLNVQTMLTIHFRGYLCPIFSQH